MAKLYSLAPQAEGGNLSSLAGEFLADLARRGYSQHTVRAYRSALNMLRNVLGDVEVTKITVQDLARVLSQQDWGPETQASRQAAVKSFFNWLFSQGYVTRDVSAGLGSVKSPEHLPRPISQTDLDAVLKAADGLPLPPRAFFRLLADTGLRAGEALSLDVCDITWEKGQEAVTVKRGKGGQGRVIPITPDMKCYPLLRRLCRESQAGPLFITNRGARTDYDWAYYHWQQLLESAELAGKGYTIHQLRHSAITRWVSGGMNLVAVRRLAGHRNMQTTSRYAAVTDAELRREVEKATRRS